MFSLSIHLSFSHPALPPFSFLSNVDPVWRLQIQDLEAQVEDVRRQLQREGEATTQLRSNLQEERSRSATLQESLVELQSEKAALAVQQESSAKERAQLAEQVEQVFFFLLSSVKHLCVRVCVFWLEVLVVWFS